MIAAAHTPILATADPLGAGTLGALVGVCPAVRLFVGGHALSVQGEAATLAGDRCYTAAHAPNTSMRPCVGAVLLDSGAFTDAPGARLSYAGAGARMRAWEAQAAAVWGLDDWQADVWVSYDLLIDETWINGHKTKRRWSVTDAEPALAVTIAAAQYLASQRAALAPRTLLLSCQGVTAAQYTRCVQAVCDVATPADWIGLGGWCIVGRYTTWLPVFYETITRSLPLIARAGVRHVHILGVLYLPALGPLLWLADQYGLTVSTDSSAPLLACTRGNAKKAGVRAPYWRDNIAIWQHTLAHLRDTRYYAPPVWQQGWGL